MSRFGTCSTFVTFLRFELMILSGFLIHFCVNILDIFEEILINENIFKFVSYVSHRHSDFKNIPKINLIIYKTFLYSIIMNMCLAWIVDYSQLWNVTKAAFVTKTWQKLEFGICLKMNNCALLWTWYRFLFKKNVWTQQSWF